jgi:type I restriction enzyme S subunit
VASEGTTNRVRLKEDQFLAMTMPLPPLEEQRRIVERLQTLSLKVGCAQQLADECDLSGNIIVDRWISQLVFAEGDWATLASAVDDKPGAVRSGPFGSQLHHEEFVAEGISAIGTRDVQVNRLLLQSGWYVSPEKFEQFRRYQVFPGDLLCTIVGASIGRFCAVPEGVPTAFTTKHIMALTLNRGISEPEYVSQILNSHQRSRQSIFSQCEGSAQPSLPARKVLAIELPLPPLGRQREILSQVGKMRAATLRLRGLGVVRKAELYALTPSLLYRAFSGQL